MHRIELEAGRSCRDHDPDGQRDRSAARRSGGGRADELAEGDPRRLADRAGARESRDGRAGRADRRAGLLGTRPNREGRPDPHAVVRRRRQPRTGSSTTCAGSWRSTPTDRRGRSSSATATSTTPPASMASVRAVGRANVPVVIHPEFWSRRRLVLPGREPWELPSTSRGAPRGGRGFRSWRSASRRFCSSDRC